MNNFDRDNSEIMLSELICSECRTDLLFVEIEEALELGVHPSDLLCCDCSNEHGGDMKDRHNIVVRNRMWKGTFDA